MKEFLRYLLTDGWLATLSALIIAFGAILSLVQSFKNHKESQDSKASAGRIESKLDLVMKAVNVQSGPDFAAEFKLGHTIFGIEGGKEIVPFRDPAGTALKVDWSNARITVSMTSKDTMLNIPDFQFAQGHMKAFSVRLDTLDKRDFRLPFDTKMAGRISNVRIQNVDAPIPVMVGNPDVELVVRKVSGGPAGVVIVMGLKPYTGPKPTSAPPD